MEELFMVVNEVDTNAVSMKGSNVIPITFSIIASVSNLTQV